MPGRKARFAGKLFRASVLRTPVTFSGQSLLRKGQFRLRRAEEPSLETFYRVRVKKRGLKEAGFEEQDAESSSNECGLFGGRGTVDGQRCFEERSAVP